MKSFEANRQSADAGAKLRIGGEQYSMSNPRTSAETAVKIARDDRPHVLHRAVDSFLQKAPDDKGMRWRRSGRKGRSLDRRRCVRCVAVAAPQWSPVAGRSLGTELGPRALAWSLEVVNGV